jgi:hypothetical protein
VPPFFIFRLAQSGGYSKLLTFPSAYGGAAVSLIAATDGNLYGTFSFSALWHQRHRGDLPATLSGRLQAMASLPAKGADEGMLDPTGWWRLPTMRSTVPQSTTPSSAMIWRRPR